MNLDISCYQQLLTFYSEQNTFKAQLCLSTSALHSLKKEATHFLTAEEQDYFSTLLYECHQHSYLLGRYCAKQAAANYNNLPITQLHNIQIKAGIFQQPLIQGKNISNTQITLSHCDDLAIALAFPDTIILGIDLETIKPHKATTMQSQMTAFELDIVKQLFPTTKFTLSLALLWTVKEALSKALRVGLTIPFEMLAIETIQAKNHVWISEFQHFMQYQAVSFQLDEFICSLVFPKSLQCVIDIMAIQCWLNTQLNLNDSVNQSPIYLQTNIHA